MREPKLEIHFLSVENVSVNVVATVIVPLEMYSVCARLWKGYGCARIHVIIVRALGGAQVTVNVKYGLVWT